MTFRVRHHNKSKSSEFSFSVLQVIRAQGPFNASHYVGQRTARGPHQVCVGGMDQGEWKIAVFAWLGQPKASGFTNCFAPLLQIVENSSRGDAPIFYKCNVPEQTTTTTTVPLQSSRNNNISNAANNTNNNNSSGGPCRSNSSSTSSSSGSLNVPFRQQQQ